MKLPNLPVKIPTLKKKEQNEYFLSLVLRDEKTSAVVFKEVEGRVDVVGEHHEVFKTTLEKADEEELFNVIDRAVSNAEKSLPDGVESQKTIFGVKQDWTENGKIKPIFLKKLKKISDELQFKPVGFLVITEALIHLLGKQEGAPVSAVIVEIGKDTLTVSLTKAGRVIETKQTKIEGSIPEQVDRLLKHFESAEILPSRVIIFDNGSDKLQQEFISHKWSQNLGFLHVPQITNLPANFDARAVLSGAATQMGFEILEGSLKRAEKEDAGAVDPIEVEDEEDKTLGEVASEFGFTQDDLAKDKKPKTAVDDQEINSDDIDSDNITIADTFKEIPEDEKIKSDRKPFPIMASGMFIAIKNSISKINIKELLKSGKSRKKILFVIIPITILIILFVLYFFMRTATVTLGVFSEEIKDSASVTFVENGETSAEDETIKIEFVTSSQDGKVTTKATGTKETGEKAKGKVTIFNNSDTGVTLQAGTVITSENDLSFTLNDAVTVASASGDIFSGTEPGKADVNVTASEIGTKYNLPSETKFDVDGHSAVKAKNGEALSGGTLEELTVVAEKDIVKLEEDLEEKLAKTAKEELEKKSSGGLVVLPEFTTITYGKKSFSKEVGDESNEVSLTATIKFEGISYRTEELVKFAKQKIDIPDGMVLDENEIDVKASKITTDEDGTTATIEINTALVPEIDTAQVAKDVTGDSFTNATRKLQQIPGVEKVNINMFLNLPLLPKRLPFSAGKIIVEVEKDG